VTNNEFFDAGGGSSDVQRWLLAIGV